VKGRARFRTAPFGGKGEKEHLHVLVWTDWRLPLMSLLIIDEGEEGKVRRLYGWRLQVTKKIGL